MHGLHNQEDRGPTRSEACVVAALPAPAAAPCWMPAKALPRDWRLRKQVTESSLLQRGALAVVALSASNCVRLSAPSDWY